MIDCLVIPIEANHFVKGEKGIYLDLIGYELKEKRDKQTHLVKQSLPEEIYKAMSEQDRNQMPIIGSHIVWSQREPEPQRVEISTPAEFKGEFADDLPF